MGNTELIGLGDEPATIRDSHRVCRRGFCVLQGDGSWLEAVNVAGASFRKKGQDLCMGAIGPQHCSCSFSRQVLWVRPAHRPEKSVDRELPKSHCTAVAAVSGTGNQMSNTSWNKVWKFLWLFFTPLDQAGGRAARW